MNGSGLYEFAGSIAIDMPDITFRRSRGLTIRVAIFYLSQIH
jgi:hypothetical protein